MLKFKKLFLLCVLIVLIITTGVTTYAFEQNVDNISLKVREASIRDVLMMLTEQSGINLVPDESVQGSVTIDLQNIDLQEALKTLTIAYGYQFDKITDSVYLVSRGGYTPPAKIVVEDGMLTVAASNSDVRNVLNQIAEKAGINIIIDPQVNGKISSNLKNVDLKSGMVTMLQANGFGISQVDGIYHVFTTGGGNANNNLAISVVDGNLSIDVEQADLGEVLRTISRICDLDMILFSRTRDVIDLKLDEVPVDKAIDIILSGTRYTYHYSDGIYMIGEKNANSPSSSLLTTSQIIPLEYLKVEKVPQLLPNDFPPSNVKVLKEQNSLLVTGTQTEINNLREYIDKIDTKIPQIVVEALIVEINREENFDPNFGVKMNYKDKDSVLLDTVLGKLTYKSILKLPQNFIMDINALEEKGKLTIKASPNITTLNGQQARIKVGTVQYYKSVQEDSDDNESVSYRSVNAGVTLEVTPWVSSSGEINLDLHPSVSNLSVVPTDEKPPVISNREVETTVRVKDGHTIVIGGLIQNVNSISENKVPVLGDLPVMGELFKSESEDVRKTELVIYITPHVLKPAEENVKDDMNNMLENAKNTEID